MIREVVDYISFFFAAKSKKRIKDPNIKDIIDTIIEDGRYFYAFDILEHARENLKSNNTEIAIRDLGAGSKNGKAYKRQISEIAKNALSSPYQCRILFRLIEHYQPKSLLELGTSLGISTAYMASASKETTIYTIDADSGVLKYAIKLFSALKLDNIKVINGDFSETLNKTLQQIGKGNLDFVFLDGNHTKKATIAYFETILPYLNDKALVIVDDIYWSNEMKEAWTQLSQHPSVKIALDLFFCGILMIEQTSKPPITMKIRISKWLYFLE